MNWTNLNCSLVIVWSQSPFYRDTCSRCSCSVLAQPEFLVVPGLSSASEELSLKCLGISLLLCLRLEGFPIPQLWHETKTNVLENRLMCPDLCIVWLEHGNNCLNGSLVYHEHKSWYPVLEFSNCPVMWVCDQAHWCCLILSPVQPLPEKQLPGPWGSWGVTVHAGLCSQWICIVLRFAKAGGLPRSWAEQAPAWRTT